MKQNILNNRIVFDGEIELNFIYGTENSNINSKPLS